MFLGRVVGWLLILIAAIMASADAVMALGPIEHSGIVTADVVTLLSGHVPEAAEPGRSAYQTIRDTVLDLPIWAAVGAMGLSLLVGCRQRHRQRRYAVRSRFSA